MKFGKLFTKLIEKHPEFKTLSANRVSLLTYKELRAIGKALYPEHKEALSLYILAPTDILRKKVYKALCEL